MRYYNYYIKEALGDIGNPIHWALKRIIGNDKTLGIGQVLNSEWNGRTYIDLVEICKVRELGGSKLEWTHLANIQLAIINGETMFEVNTQFNGENEDEMWIYRYFKTFTAAVKYIVRNGMENSQPIEIYK